MPKFTVTSQSRPKKTKKPYFRGKEAKKRSQFPDELFSIFKEALKHLQLDEESVDMSLLLRSGYLKFFPKQSKTEPKNRIDRVSNATTSVGKELGNYVKITNHPVAQGTQPIDPRLGKVNEMGHLTENYHFDPEHAVVLARSLDHIISLIEQGIYELVDEGQKPHFLVFKINPFYLDSQNKSRPTNVSIDGLNYRYRVDLRKIVEIADLKKQKNKQTAKAQVKNLIPQKPILTLEQLKQYANQEVSIKNKNKSLGRLNYEVGVKFSSHEPYKKLLIATDKEGHPIVSDVDGFALLLPDKYWELLARKYQELHPGETFTAADAKRLFNSVIFTSDLENDLYMNRVPEEKIQQVRERMISTVESLHAFHFLLHVFHPDYKNIPYSKRITRKEEEILDNLMKTSERGVTSPLILLLISLLNSHDLPHISDIAKHGFEGHNIVVPQPIRGQGITSIRFSTNTCKFSVALANGPENLAQLLKDFPITEQPLEMCANPVHTPDWIELTANLQDHPGIRVKPDPGLELYCKYSLSDEPQKVKVKDRAVSHYFMQHRSSSLIRSASFTLGRNAMKTTFAHFQPDGEPPPLQPLKIPQGSPWASVYLPDEDLGTPLPDMPQETKPTTLNSSTRRRASVYLPDEDLGTPLPDMPQETKPTTLNSSTRRTFPLYNLRQWFCCTSKQIEPVGPAPVPQKNQTKNAR